MSLLAELARDTWEGDPATVSQRAHGVRVVLGYLTHFPEGRTNDPATQD